MSDEEDLIDVTRIVEQQIISIDHKEHTAV